jgi:hypothetical protein
MIPESNIPLCKEVRQMKGQSFINFLYEEEGKADRQKVLSISALVGSSVLAQLMFAGVTHAACADFIDCHPDAPDKAFCIAEGCVPSCPQGTVGIGTCHNP